MGFDLLLQKQRAYFQSGATRAAETRLENLSRLEAAILEREGAILEALRLDLKKPRQEAWTTEIAVLIEEIRYAKKNLKSWLKPKTVLTPIYLQPAKSRIYRDPLGVVLIIGPWNYPFQLSISPLVAAIAAGNCAIVKPSELAPHTSALVYDLINKTFSEEFVAVREGGVDETTALLALKFDHVFFTGSTKVGRIVMRAAAETLTPVTLELGGKSPAVVTESADVKLAAKRITWGKYLNTGQTCVAPDYALVHESRVDAFLEAAGNSIREFYGQEPMDSPGYGRMINTQNFDRIDKLLESAKIAAGGERRRDLLYIAPTVLRGVSWSDPIMQEEIFGPVLPVLGFQTLGEAFGRIQSLPRPLAAYLFSNDKKEQDGFLTSLSFGGGCINDTVVHLSNPRLPFGGVGMSGLGAYHGQKGFETFSHEKSVLIGSRWFDPSFRYPPFSERSLKWIRTAMGL